MGRLLNQEKLVKAMEQVLDEGKKLDQQMTKLAEEEINPQMLEGKDEEGHEEGDENEEERTREGSGRLSKRTKLKQRTKSR